MDGVCCLVPDGLGNVYVVGSVVDDSRTNVSVTKLDSNNRVAARFSFGGGLTDQPQAAALDAQGDRDKAAELYQKAAMSADQNIVARCRYNLGCLAVGNIQMFPKPLLLKK